MALPDTTVAPRRAPSGVPRADIFNRLGAQMPDLLGALVVVLDREGRVVMWNSAAAACSGWAEHEVAGRYFFDLVISQEERAAVIEEFGRLRAGNFPTRFENDWVTRDGRHRRLRWVNTCHVDENGKIVYVIGTGQDVTELRVLEKRVQAADRLEAAGRLAAGLAHDFNNLLTILSTHASLLHTNAHDPVTVREDAALILQSVDRAAGLVRKLLAFAQGTVTQPVVIEPADSIRALVDLFARSLGRRMKVATVLPSDAPRVKLDPTHLEQILMNLLVNARDALADGGRIQVRVESVSLNADDAVLAGTGAAPGSFLRLSVIDNGSGMDEATAARAFEPFFTTKAPGRGTGLGLPTVHGLVRQNGGFVALESVRGIGTAVDVFLPVTQEAPVAALDQAARFDAGIERVLLVGARTTVLLGVERALSAAGLPIELTLDPVSLLRANRASGSQKPVVLIADAPLPPDLGASLMRLVNEDPRVNLVIMVTHSAEQAVLAVPAGRCLYLPKPFTVEQLFHAVRNGV